MRETDYVRKQYHFWPAERGFDAWDVDRLIELSRELPVEQVTVDSIGEIDTSYWFDGSAEVPTVRKVVEHCPLITEVDGGNPIILGAMDGRVMDDCTASRGPCSREGLSWTPFGSLAFEPDYRCCLPEELPY